MSRGHAVPRLIDEGDARLNISQSGVLGEHNVRVSKSTFGHAPSVDARSVMYRRIETSSTRQRESPE